MSADGNHLYPAGQPRVSRVVGADLPRATAADAARTLAASTTAGTLSTLAVEPAGYPFGSVISFTVDPNGDPLFVISRLAVHTANVLADPRASLLVAEAVEEGVDPLARGRVTLLGEVAPVPTDEQDAAVETVAASVPGVAGYASYGDFACYRLRVGAVRWVGGSARWTG
jgi:putative heme iron utilization protein